ncbi:MAG: hypothetical protein ACRDAG_02560 [Cetobacterium somerae]|uniref:Uncharacterized protein n=1 Tax=Cetobacterium somerae ATCC BAA-474 TaxID=1319815 RepID=U7VF94_9FUSO|nr:MULTISPECIES: hypothetical protein [Cetobacterium]ERT69503.1 hypothetical protein HMPREF0202_00531 [Cetobacterium somerae ATCC BAA-474]MBC2853197.1 hypothetical protein [Cetobacterium sp. 2G large]MCQ9625758.1 hypothetical protein [Cetobacterium somerae]WVJ01368.1 hypothetical protein VSU16_01245 [Cetobacterium somerae]
MVLRKYRLVAVSIFRIFTEILYEILKKFSVIYYLLFVFGLLFSIKNNNVTKEAVIVSTFFLIFTWGYCKFYNKLHNFLYRIELELT